jgi:hypothetical protein
MASYYSIIQYVPNPIANERINIGVLIFDDKEIKVKFLKNWNRVKNFCMGDITFLRDFESQMQEAVSQGLLFPGDPLLDQPRQDRLQRVSESWMNSVQFTEPNFSLKPVDKLLEDSIKKYLIEPVPSESLGKLLESLQLPQPKISSFKEMMLKQRLGELSGSLQLPKSEKSISESSEFLDSLSKILQSPKPEKSQLETFNEMIKQHKQLLGELSGSPPLPKPNIRSSVTVYTPEGMRSVIGSDAQNDPLMEALEKVDNFKHNS